MSSSSDIPEHITDLIDRAHQFAMDLARHARQEAGQGHLSPTDRALLARVETFLSHEIPVGLTGQERPE